MTFTIDSKTYHAKYYERHADGSPLELPPMGLFRPSTTSTLFI